MKVKNVIATLLVIVTLLSTVLLSGCGDTSDKEVAPETTPDVVDTEPVVSEPDTEKEVTVKEDSFTSAGIPIMLDRNDFEFVEFLSSSISYKTRDEENNLFLYCDAIKTTSKTSSQNPVGGEDAEIEEDNYIDLARYTESALPVCVPTTAPGTHSVQGYVGDGYIVCKVKCLAGKDEGKIGIAVTIINTNAENKINTTVDYDADENELVAIYETFDEYENANAFQTAIDNYFANGTELPIDPYAVEE